MTTNLTEATRIILEIEKIKSKLMTLGKFENESDFDLLTIDSLAFRKKSLNLKLKYFEDILLLELEHIYTCKKCDY